MVSFKEGCAGVSRPTYTLWKFFSAVKEVDEDEEQ
jgi:hypothetical protein